MYLHRYSHQPSFNASKSIRFGDNKEDWFEKPNTAAPKVPLTSEIIKPSPVTTRQATSPDSPLTINSNNPVDSLELTKQRNLIDQKGRRDAQAVKDKHRLLKIGGTIAGATVGAIGASLGIGGAEELLGNIAQHMDAIVTTLAAAPILGSSLAYIGIRRHEKKQIEEIQKETAEQIADLGKAKAKKDIPDVVVIPPEVPAKKGLLKRLFRKADQPATQPAAANNAMSAPFGAPVKPVVEPPAEAPVTATVEIPTPSTSTPVIAPVEHQATTPATVTEQVAEAPAIITITPVATNPNGLFGADPSAPSVPKPPGRLRRFTQKAIEKTTSGMKAVKIPGVTDRPKVEDPNFPETHQPFGTAVQPVAPDIEPTPQNTVVTRAPFSPETAISDDSSKGTKSRVRLWKKSGK